jgi:hypothetical protein
MRRNSSDLDARPEPIMSSTAETLLATADEVIQ